MWQYSLVGISALILGLFHSLTWSFAWMVLYGESMPRNERLERGSIAMAVVCLVTAVMTLGSWTAVPSVATTTSYLVVSLQCMSMITSICLASARLETIGGGIFYYTMGITVVEPAKVVGLMVLGKHNTSSWQPVASWQQQDVEAGTVVPSGRMLGGGGTTRGDVMDVRAARLKALEGSG
jgi:hypothetical protein